MNRGWGYPSAGPSNDPNVGNSSFGGNPGPGGSGGNRPPTNEFAINQQSGNRDNPHRDQRISRFYPTNQDVRPERVPGSTIHPSTIHISHLKSQQNAEYLNPDPAVLGQRPYSHSPVFGSYPEERNILNTNDISSFRCDFYIFY
jgi:hypothetical protein